MGGRWAGGGVGRGHGRARSLPPSLSLSLSPHAYLGPLDAPGRVEAVRLDLGALQDAALELPVGQVGRGVEGDGLGQPVGGLCCGWRGVEGWRGGGVEGWMERGGWSEDREGRRTGQAPAGTRAARGAQGRGDVPPRVRVRAPQVEILRGGERGHEPPKRAPQGPFSVVSGAAAREEHPPCPVLPLSSVTPPRTFARRAVPVVGRPHLDDAAIVAVDLCGWGEGGTGRREGVRARRTGGASRGPRPPAAGPHGPAGSRSAPAATPRYHIGPDRHPTRPTLGRLEAVMGVWAGRPRSCQHVENGRAAHVGMARRAGLGLGLPAARAWCGVVCAPF